ncbi:MAG: ribonuclease III [Nitrolancea sp.]
MSEHASETSSNDLPPIWSDERAEQAAESLGVSFDNLDLLRLALTHRSYLNEQGVEQLKAVHHSNERLEFIGDSILGMITAEFLYQRYPDLPEGALTAYRTALVRTETLADWARRFQLDTSLYLSRGESVDEGDIRDRILAGAFEAVIAAIYFDQGLAATRDFLHDLLEEDAEEIISVGQETNYKGRLQELVQEWKRITPVYNTLSVEGPAHDRTFTVEVLVDGESMGVGAGSSKRMAQQVAARRALVRLLAEGVS